MGQTLYMECYSGISGDMTVAALIDLGADREELDRALKSLPVTGFRTEISRVNKSGLDACDFAVILNEENENHDHDMEYLHGHEHGDKLGCAYGHHEHDEGHSHCHGHDHGYHHRGMPEILEIIDQAQLTHRARETAKRIFRILAEAEAQAHGVPVEEVHFHEVGAVDSIVDIVAAAVCLDNLNITEVLVPHICEGTGTVRCQHGILPVPVPAVTNIVKNHDIKIEITPVRGELVTPTGAAIIAAVRTGETLPEKFSVKAVGLGAGKRSYECPGILRAMLIRGEETEKDRDLIWRLETNVDDCTGEELGFVMEQLLEAGARDVSYTPVFMKKNRPAYQLNVICSKEAVPVMEEIIFRETTTIGIRRMEMERTLLPREIRRIRTLLGEAEVKCCFLPDGSQRCYPEYESAARLAKSSGRPLREVYGYLRDCGEET